jgi:hypothetical protein
MRPPRDHERPGLMTTLMTPNASRRGASLVAAAEMQP